MAAVLYVKNADAKRRLCPKGWWRGRRTQRAARVFVMSKHVRSLLLATKTFCTDNEAPSPAPPPPRFARFASSSGPPPPLSRGRKARAIAFSRRPSRPSFAARTKATAVSLPSKIKGGGAPEGANRIGRTTRTDVATCPRYGRGARHGRSACTNRPLRARSPFGAPPRRSPGCYP